MLNLSRRTFLAGFGAAAVTSAMRAFAQYAPMPAARMVRTNGITMAVYEAGSGPAIVLLHGFPGLAFTWRHQIPALVTAGYRVVVPDLRGYGLTDAPQAVEAYDIAQLTATSSACSTRSTFEKPSSWGTTGAGCSPGRCRSSTRRASPA